MGVTFYCGINETAWNGQPVEPGPFACIAPVYGASERTKRANAVSVPLDTQVIQDSGAFSDGPGQRLSFSAALDRQRAHAEKWGYAGQITHLASYDLLIDEVWTEGNRYKRRWSEGEAAAAIIETVNAARFLSQHHNGIDLILSAQGVTPRQYLDCARQVIDQMRESDALGLGGWCITGKMPRQMMPSFRETIGLVIPYAAGAGVKRIHIWGVIYASALGELLWLCDHFGLVLSTDSAGPSMRPAFGEWGYADWYDIGYRRPPLETRGQERIRHVQATREWLTGLERTKYYREPKIAAHQLTLWEE